MLHQYKLNGYNIVLDTCSGAVHVVDDVAYDIIAEYENKSRDEIVRDMLDKYNNRSDVTEEEINACIDDIEALKEDGQLFTPDMFEDMAGTFKERSGNVIKAL